MSQTPNDLALFSGALADLVAATAPSIVEVASHRSLASGFVWRDNLIVTAEETLADSGEVLIELADGSVHEASVVGRDATTDIALLRVKEIGAAPVVFTAGLPRTGSLALSIGAANSAPLVALGAVGAVGEAWRSMRGGEISARIELDLRLRSRGQGGLALTGDGAVIGMAVRGPRGRALVIPAATIDRVAPLLLEHGRVPRGYLGLGLREVAIGEGTVGAMIMAVDGNGPGNAAGLHQGDVIATWDGEPIVSVGRLLRALGPTSVGKAVLLGIRRGGQALEVSVTIGERPAA
jgi:S1-C subfamily serine protease